MKLVALRCRGGRQAPELLAARVLPATAAIAAGHEVTLDAAPTPTSRMEACVPSCARVHEIGSNQLCLFVVAIAKTQHDDNRVFDEAGLRRSHGSAGRISGPARTLISY